MSTPTSRAQAEAARARREADLERALVRRGVRDADLDDARALLDRDVEDAADPDHVADVADALLSRRPELFENVNDESQRRRSAGGFPGGSGPKKRNGPQGREPGAYGRARAEQRFGPRGVSSLEETAMKVSR